MDSQNAQIIEYAEKQPMNVHDFKDMYLFKFEKDENPLFSKAKKECNEEVERFANDVLSTICDDEGCAPSGMLQYYMRLWTDRNFYIWYGENGRTSYEELDIMKEKAEHTSKLFNQNMSILCREDPKIISAKFTEDIMGYTRKKNTWELYNKVFKYGNINDWYIKLMEDEKLRKMYDMDYEWVEGAKTMNAKCQMCLALLIQPQTQLKNFTNTK